MANSIAKGYVKIGNCLVKKFNNHVHIIVTSYIMTHKEVYHIGITYYSTSRYLQEQNHNVDKPITLELLLPLTKILFRKKNPPTTSKWVIHGLKVNIRIIWILNTQQ